jgi:hypothetical protein
LASPPNQQVVGVPRERPQLAHVAIGLAVVPFIIFPLHLILEGSALVSIVIFNMLSILLTFPLKGPLWCKILWLGLGNLAGSAWNLIRLSLINATAELVTLNFLHFVIGPTIDFLWMVPIWAVGLSVLVSAERRKISREEGRQNC